MIKNFANKYVWIIGGSSGIGLAVAKQLADEGAILILSARSQSQLDDLNANLPGEHDVLPMDVTDNDQIKQVVAEMSKQQIDSVLFFAADYQPAALLEMNVQQAKNIVDINLNGALNTIAAVLPTMQTQGFGQIALCGSVAGYMGLPNGQPYSATKAAIINLAESLRAEQSILDIKLINPGFVSTPLTNKNDFKMPMIMTSERAASEIVKGLKSDCFEIHFPKKFTRLLKLLRLLPYSLYFWLIRKYS